MNHTPVGDSAVTRHGERNHPPVAAVYHHPELISKMSTDATVKGLEVTEEKFDGSKLRIGIVHARWNKTVIEALVAGAVAKLKERGVLEQNIVTQTVPGSYELPFAVSK